MSFKFRVRVIPKSSQNKVEYFSERKVLKVWTTAPPVEGKANQAVVEQVADYLKLNKKFVQIKTGLTSKDKIVEVSVDISEDELDKKPKLFD